MGDKRGKKSVLPLPEVIWVVEAGPLVHSGMDSRCVVGDDVEGDFCAAGRAAGVS